MVALLHTKTTSSVHKDQSLLAGGSLPLVGTRINETLCPDAPSIIHVRLGGTPNQQYSYCLHSAVASADKEDVHWGDAIMIAAGVAATKERSAINVVHFINNMAILVPLSSPPSVGEIEFATFGLVTTECQPVRGVYLTSFRHLEMGRLCQSYVPIDHTMRRKIREILKHLASSRNSMALLIRSFQPRGVTLWIQP